MASCSPKVGLTSWKNPGGQGKISAIVVMAMFDKLTYIKPFEEQLVSCFNNGGMKSTGSLEILVPFTKYPSAVLRQKFDSIGADGVLLVTYRGTDIAVNQAAGWYGGYSWWYGGGAQLWTTTTVSIRARLYDLKKDQLLWTGDLTVTDPDNLDASFRQVALTIFADWTKYDLLKTTPTTTQK
jgi:hypothetical protein